MMWIFGFQWFITDFSQNMEVVGYLHVFIEKVEAKKATEPIHLKLTLGEVAKVDSTPKPSGSVFNEVFLIEVPNDPSRFILNCHEGQTKIGESRYDVLPFFEHQGKTHTIETELYDDENQVAGSIKMKITFYSSKHGKLRVRIFHLEFVPQIIEMYKEAKVKVRFGFYAQSTPIRSLTEPFDEYVDLLVLHPSMNLSFDIVHEKGILATYTIKNAEEGGMLKQEAKAYQVSLFNQDKAVGLIKYQLDWIRKK